MPAYYNEIDPKAAQWLRNLIAAGHIAQGEVDERSITDVSPGDLRGFNQCHFFAGVGVWSYALRQAGWADDRKVWTGSCPCQPFSNAGGGAEFDDARHLWPAWIWLIRECRPVVVTGEQVAAKVGLAWLDIVCSDLEATGYAVGAVDTCAAGFGAPHIRQRFYFVAHPKRDGQQEGRRVERDKTREGAGAPWRDIERRGQLGDADEWRSQGPTERIETGGHGSVAPGPTNGFWSNAEWIPCRDGKARPVEPGTFPLAHGAPARVVRLRAYGNAINAVQAAEFIRAYMSLETSP